jgi:hypothetical protein
MSAHTPGPWTYQPTAGNHDFAAYPEATGRDVALVRDFNEANARLIAAAPELLGALRLFVALDPRCHRGVTQCGECAACLGARALAKVTP